MESLYNETMDYGYKPSHGLTFITQSQFLECDTSFPYISRRKPNHQSEGTRVIVAHTKDGNNPEEFNLVGKVLDKEGNGNLQCS